MSSSHPLPPFKVLRYGLYITGAKNYLREALADEYDLDYGVAQTYAHLKRAMRQEPKALNRLDAALENRRSIFDAGLYDISEACQRIKLIVGDDAPSPGECRRIMRQIGKAHWELGKQIQSLGFRLPTDADYGTVRDQIGYETAGGGR